MNYLTAGESHGPQADGDLRGESLLACTWMSIRSTKRWPLAKEAMDRGTAKNRT